MLLIPCPHCGERPEIEFRAGGEAHVARPADPMACDDQAWSAHLYTRTMLEEAFGDFRDLKIEEEEREMREGAAHAGMSAVIHLTGRKP